MYVQRVGIAIQYRRYLYRNTFKSICIGIPILLPESIGIGIVSGKNKYRVILFDISLFGNFSACGGPLTLWPSLIFPK